MLRVFTGVCITAALSICGATARAEITRDAANRLCVDIVVVERGADVRGMIVSRANDGGATLAVRRGWLREAQPELYEEFRESELESQRAGDELLVERIDAWIAELDPDEDRQFIAILEGEREDVSRRIEDPEGDDESDDDEFLLMEFSADRIREIHVQPDRRRQAGLCAFYHGLMDVEETILTELESELSEYDPSWQSTTVDLTSRLASQGVQSDREWAARQAIFDHQYRKPINFQGTGDAIVQVDAGGQGDMGAFLDQMLSGGLTGDLGDLLDLPELEGIGGGGDSNRWRDRAIAVASDAGARACRVTRVSPDLAGGTATVEDVLLARMPDGSWEAIWSATVTATPADVPEGAVDRIREDPQVEQVISTAELLGIGGAELEQALSFGAATMQAQTQADTQFFDFVGRYLEALDGPPLAWQ